TGCAGRSRAGRPAYTRAFSRYRSSGRASPSLHLIEDLRRHVVRAPPAVRYLVQPLRQQFLHARRLQEPAPHAALQDGTRPRRQALPPPLGEPAACLKIGVMAIESSRELVYSFTGRRDGTEHRRLPKVGRLHGRTAGRTARSVRPMVWSDVAKRIPPPDAEHHLDLLTELVRARTVALVHHVDVGDLHDPGFQGLNPVARFGHQYEDRGLGGARDVELRLPDAHRLYQHALEAERLEQIGDFLRRRGQPALR